MLHFEGLKNRIIKYYFTKKKITIKFFEGLYMIYIKNYYYDYVRQSLSSYAYFTRETYSTASSESDSFENKIRSILEKESLKTGTKYSVQIINKYKTLIIDQYGIRTNTKVEYDDVNRALSGSDTLTPYVYRNNQTNEHLMSISVPIKVNNIIEGVARYTVSLTDIDKVILKLVSALIIAGLFILIITISISLRFSESIIQPLR